MEMTQRNLKYMNSSQKFADQLPLQFALREVQSIFQNYRFWVGFSAVVIILTIAGPFGTLLTLGHAERLVYWALHAGLTFFTGLFVAIFTITSLQNIGMNSQLAKAIGSFSVGFPVSIIVWCLNEYGFSLDMGGVPEYLKSLGYCLGISTSISLLYFLINNEPEEEKANSKADTEVKFLDRLSKHLGSNLLHVTSQDHYVEVTTELGSELILLRLSDAVAELEKISGMQIHRSHWVADKAVKELIKKNSSLFILTTDGKQLPVSRSNAKLVRERYQA